MEAADCFRNLNTWLLHVTGDEYLYSRRANAWSRLVQLHQEQPVRFPEVLVISWFNHLCGEQFVTLLAKSRDHRDNPELLGVFGDQLRNYFWSDGGTARGDSVRVPCLFDTDLDSETSYFSVGLMRRHQERFEDTVYAQVYSEASGAASARSKRLCPRRLASGSATPATGRSFRTLSTSRTSCHASLQPMIGRLWCASSRVSCPALPSWPPSFKESSRKSVCVPSYGITAKDIIARVSSHIFRRRALMRHHRCSNCG